MRILPLLQMSAEKSLAEAPDDGDYLVVCHTGHRYMTRYRFSVENPFPWQGSIYRFKDGECDLVSTCSQPQQLTESHAVKQVIFVGLTKKLTAEAEEKFLLADVKLEKIAA